MQHCLSCCVSLLSAPNLEARLEGSFGVPDVWVLLILEPEGVVLSPVLPFLFAALWAGGVRPCLALVIHPFLVDQGSVHQSFSSGLRSAFPVAGINGL